MNTIYNRLNLPDSVSFPLQGNTMKLEYLADGRRVRTTAKTYGTPLVLPGGGSTPQNPMNILEEVRDGELVFRDGQLVELRTDGGWFSMWNDTLSATQVRPYFYVTDYLGSVRMTVDGVTGGVEQSLEYLPSGYVFRSDNYAEQPYMFCGKELVKMHGWNMYDSNARFQHSKQPRFSSIDPLAEQYYSFSPYNYAGNDPVNAADPSGLDAYVYNSEGKLIDVSTYGIWRYQDCFVVVNDDGTLSWGPVFDLGTFIEYSEFELPQSFNGGGGSSYYKFSDSKRASLVYEFLANNTSSEWSLYKFLNNDSYMFTSFEQNQERGGSFFLYKYYGKDRLKSLSHSHPDNTAYPSGVSVYNMGNGKDNDMNQIYWFVDTFGYEPDFFIYLPATGVYLQYSSKSRVGDFKSLFIDIIKSHLPF